MTLGQVGALIEGEQHFHDPKGSTSPRSDEGTAADLLMFAAMKVH